MIEISPRKQFLRNAEETHKFNELMADPVVAKALTYAFAEFGQSGITPDEFIGAKKFIMLLSRFGTIDETPKLPEKTLQSF
jgi:hypothetical protein